MKLQAKAGSQFAALDDSDAGEGLAIFFSQSDTDTTRWRLEVSATLDNGAEKLVGFFYVSPPNATTPLGTLTRQVAAAVCPGAKSWSVMCRPSGGPIAAAEQTADIELASSKCCTAPVGVTRVGERYGYMAGVVPNVVTSFAVLPGQTITRIVANNNTGVLGSISINGGGSIPIPTGTSITLEPKGVIPPGPAALTFLNAEWVAEYTESA